MQVTITAAQGRLVKALVKSGRYRSDHDVIRASLRLLEKHERDLNDEMRDFRAQIEVGLLQARQGRVVDGEAAFARLRRKPTTRRRRART